VQYTYDQRNQLTQVESHDGSSFQLQAEMVYDGNGNRLQAIAHASGSTITATYTLDPRSGLPLLVDNGTNVTMILYGQVAIGEYAVQTAEWHYYLGDAQLSVRQLMDESGIVTQAQTYGPYGVLLHQAGDGGGLFGYKGGQSSANGLWYFGDGYFDPATGQFLATNGSPLLPLAAAAMANPGGLLFGPILFISWRKRKGKKGVHPATFLLFGVLLAASLSGCGGGGATETTEAPIIPPGADPIHMPTVTVEVSGADATEANITITVTPSCSQPPEQSKRFDKIIFICGVGDGTACASGNAPLHPFREMAERNGYTESDFSILDTDVCGSKLECATQAQTKLESSGSSRFLLIGHSAGGSAVIIAAHRVSDKGRIAGIALLDPAMDATLEDGVVNLQSMADGLTKPVFLGDSPQDGDDKIAGASEVLYEHLNHEELALNDEVVRDMLEQFTWCELK
jgi:hypothetical protein